MNTILDEIIKKETEACLIENNLEIAKRMINNNESSETILKYLPNLDLKTINSLKAELQPTT